jgi:hypothetical protein
MPAEQSFLRLGPPNLILTPMKKSEDGTYVVLRFHAAERNQTPARIHLPRAARSAWRTSLAEENQESLTPDEDGSLRLNIQPWESTTLKLTIRASRQRARRTSALVSTESATFLIQTETSHINPLDSAAEQDLNCCKCGKPQSEHRSTSRGVSEY